MSRAQQNTALDGPLVTGAARGRPTFVSVVTEARKVGASPETVSALKKEAKAAQEARQKPGTKLNVLERKVESAKEKVLRLEKCMDRLQQELAQAAQELEEARQVQETAEQDPQGYPRGTGSNLGYSGVSWGCRTYAGIPWGTP